MRVLEHLLYSTGLATSARDEVVRLMGAAGRHYHGLGHIGVLWSRHRKYCADTPFGCPAANRLIACAIALHDAIYDPLRKDNESRSAALWREVAPRDMCPDDVEWVAATIEATANHLGVTDAGSDEARLRLWMLDLDLTPIGERPAVFARQSQQLRLESAAVEEVEWRQRRVVFLRHLAAAPQIYRSAPLAAAFERQARANVALALQAAQ